jgi:hypothetical protein
MPIIIQDDDNYVQRQAGIGEKVTDKSFESKGLEKLKPEKGERISPNSFCRKIKRSYELIFNSNMSNIINLKFFQKKWQYRLSYYLIIFLSIGLISNFIIFRYGVFNTNSDSARYMLSALIQSEAAIFAIVITLSLVAVQQTSSSYSPRAIEIFQDIRKNSDFFILVTIYLIAMIYGAWVLKQINEDNFGNLANFENPVLFPFFESHVKLAYILGIFAFVALVPYIYHTLNLLNPFKIIELLSENITKEKLLSSFEKGQEWTPKYMEDQDYICLREIMEKFEDFDGIKYINDEKNPIQPIIDIIRGSLMRYDYETARKGLKAVGKCTNDIFKNENIADVTTERLLNHLIKQYKGLGHLALKSTDDDSIMQIIINLRENAIRASEKKIVKTTLSASNLIEKIGLQMVEENSEKLAECAKYSLELIENSMDSKKGLITKKKVKLENLIQRMNT